MNEDNPPRKKHLGWLKKSHPEPASDLEEERGRGAANDPSSLLPSSNGSRGRLSGLLNKATKRFARSSRRSSNTESTAANSSAQDIPPIQITQDLSLLTAPTLEPNDEQAFNSGISKVESPPDMKLVIKTLANAQTGVAGIGHAPTLVQNTSSAAGSLQSVSDAIDTFSTILEPLKVFNSVATGLADIHPYAKVALSIFTCASKMILDQADRDDAVHDLLTKISDVYTFITEEEELTKMQSMLAVYVKIAQQTLECADFISHYSETKSAWRRLGKDIFNETDATIKSYSDVLDSLMQQFRDRAARDTVVIIHHMAESPDLIGMEYATGARLNKSRCCLPGTRQDILKDIQNWIRSTEEDAPRVLWLSGTAGKGKSAVAHTIVNWYIEQGGLGSCFCFDRTRQADRRQDKIFTTIASELADCNPIMRRALAQAVHDNNGLKRTLDITRQWHELIVGPTSITSQAIAAPVLIIIEALDESGEADSREQILRLLSGKLNSSTSQLAELPENFRILVTSRPLEDIGNALHTPSRVRHISLDDAPSASTDRDIQLYISTRLEDLHKMFNEAHFKTLAQKSDGLFEWARLACEYIKGTNNVGLGPKGRFNALIAGTFDKGTRLLDIMYRMILAAIMPEDESISIFHSVMGQIIASVEPLPMPVLTAMRRHFPQEACNYKVDRVIGSLGSLLTGITDPHTPIRPLHASFYDFLTNESRSGDFFVDMSAAHNDLAFASLRVMERGLRFNICSLENSYLPNSAIPDLEKRVKESISTELSYSCRAWGTHIGATSFKSSLAKEVEAFFDGERLLWWLEALALMKCLSGSVDTLLSIASWVMGHAKFMHVSDATRDTLRFVRTFATTILHSTPHLYISALPFAPTQSRIFRKFAAKFPRTPRIVAGHIVNWPQMEKILHANDKVNSVAISPDGKRVACGLYDGTIQVWDMETGEALCAPLQGHIDRVASVAFSRDGHHIVSGSFDKTVQVWDTVTGKALGAPFEGHIDWVTCVAISSNGNRIVSGSWDNTIRVWDIETGAAFGNPLYGDTISGYSTVAISPNGNHIVSGSNDATLFVWDMETSKALGNPLQGHTGGVQSVAISPNGKYIVSGSYDKTIRVWDMETRKAFCAPLQGHTAHVQSVTISSDGNRIVSGSSDQTIRVWDLKTGAALGFPLQGHTSDVQSVAISPDGTRIVSGSWDKTIHVWDANTITGKASVAALQSHTDSVNSVAISHDGKCIVSGSSDQTVRVWDMGTGKALGAPLRGHTGSVQSVAISLDGKAIVSGALDTTIWVWDMGTGTGKALTSVCPGYHVYSVAISPDFYHIVSGSKTIRILHSETGKASGKRLKGHYTWVQSVAISSDGTRIVSGSRDMTIQVWDMETGKASNARLRGHTHYVFSVAISLDGRRVVSGSGDKTIRVWDIETGETLGVPLKGHTGSVYCVAISQNGQHIVSGSSDKTIRVWDTETSKAVGAPFRGHTGTVWSVAISPDGKRIVSGSRDKTIRVWNIEFLDQPHPFTALAICFSPNPIHTLHSASLFLPDSSTPVSVIANGDGWVVGPDGRLLLWIPLNFHPVMYAPGNTLVIANNPLQLDLSRVAHGTSWLHCRK